MAQAAAVATVVAVVGSTYYSEKARKQEKKAVKRAEALAKEQTQMEREEKVFDLQETERKNKNLLAQQQSAYKAKLGSSGLSHLSGSGQVIMDAMAKEVDMENKYQAHKTAYALKSLNNRLRETSNRNLLTLNKLRIGQQSDALNAATSLTKLTTKSE